MDFNVNVRVSLDDDAKTFLTGLFAGLRSTTSTVGAVSQTVVETPKVTKPAKPAPAKVQEPDTAAEKKAADEAEEARQIAARAQKAKDDAAAEQKAKDDAAAEQKAKDDAAAAAKAEQEAAATEETVEDPLAPAPAEEPVVELTIQIVKEKLTAYRAIEGHAALMELLGKYDAKDLPSLKKEHWAAIVADAG